MLVSARVMTAMRQCSQGATRAARWAAAGRPSLAAAAPAAAVRPGQLLAARAASSMDNNISSQLMDQVCGGVRRLPAHGSLLAAFGWFVCLCGLGYAFPLLPTPAYTLPLLTIPQMRGKIQAALNAEIVQVEDMQVGASMSRALQCNRGGAHAAGWLLQLQDLFCLALHGTLPAAQHMPWCP